MAHERGRGRLLVEKPVPLGGVDLGKVIDDTDVEPVVGSRRAYA
jgi:hypothetical protein